DQQIADSSSGTIGAGPNGSRMSLISITIRLAIAVPDDVATSARRPWVRHPSLAGFGAIDCEVHPRAPDSICGTCWVGHLRASGSLGADGPAGRGRPGSAPSHLRNTSTLYCLSTGAS